MKRLPVVILFLVVVLVAMVTGCGGAPQYDSRLTAADSLMRGNPDSALVLLEAIPAADLTAEGDRAYRDLLLTQARYRCYVTATSDSDINRALSYYLQHSGEREKLTRAYIYKGAVMEELGHPDSAMLYYKHAEATAAPDDYFNQGYVRLRIGELYQDQFSQDSAAIIRLHGAKHYFELLEDTNYLITTLGKLGAISGTITPDTTEYYLEKAITLAQEYNPSLQYTYKSKLSGLCIHEENYLRANQLAMDVLRNGAGVCGENQFYFYACISYLRLGKPDSAKCVLAMIPYLENAVDSMNYYNVKAEIALTEGDMDDYGAFVALSKEITTNILFSKKENEVTQADLKFDQLQLEDKSRKVYSSLGITIIIATLLTLLLIGTILRIRYKLKSFAKEKAAIERELESSLTDLSQLQSAQEQQGDKNSKLISELVGYRLSAIGELYDSLRVRILDENRVKRIVPLSSLLKTMNERNEMLKVCPSGTFWQKMRLSVDGEFNNIVTFIENNYPKLTERDIKLFCLVCANVSPQIIKLCMNFDNARSVSNQKNKLIRLKMGLDMTFDQFIEAYMRGEIG